MKPVSSRRRKQLIAAAVTVIVLAALFGYRWYKAKNAPLPAFESPKRGDLEVHFKDIGDIAPKTYVDIASKVSGRVLEMRVHEGAVVKAGQALAVIQPGRTESEKYVPSVVMAPISGTVMRYVSNSVSGDRDIRYARVGDYVTGLFDSQTPTYLMTVADLARMIVKMQISEMDILKLIPGQPVSVTIDAIPDRIIPAKVSLIPPQAEKNNNNLKVFKVEVELDQTDAKLKPGMTARVDALLQSKRNVLKIPLSTVFEEKTSHVVYVENIKDKPVKTEVRLGLRSDMEVELLEPTTISENDLLRTEKPAQSPKIVR